MHLNIDMDLNTNKYIYTYIHTFIALNRFTQIFSQCGMTKIETISIVRKYMIYIVNLITDLP